MRNALTIAGKELSSYFVQPVAYVVLTVFVLLAGWFFFALLKQFSEMVQVYSAMSNAQALEHLNLNARVIDPLLHNMSVVMVILVPAITMRAFAEEKRTGTYEFLLTAPIRTGEIVAGKFIAAAVFILIMVALIWIFPIILMVFGDPEVGVMGAGYVALAPSGRMLRGDRAVHFVAHAKPDHRGNQLPWRAAAALCDFVAAADRRRNPRRLAALSFAAATFRPDGRRRDRYQRHRLLLHHDLRGLVSDPALGRVGAVAVG